MAYRPFFPGPLVPVSGSVYGSVYASVPRRWFCPVFHGARPVPFTTGVGHFFPRVPVPPGLGPCTGPCTRRCLVCGFTQFSMARVQFRPRRASGTFFTCPRTARSGSVYGSVYASVPRRWFWPVFHGTRPVTSRTGVGHFFPVSTYRPFWVRVRVRVRVGASSVVLPTFPWRASSSVHDGRRAFFCPGVLYPFFACVSFYNVL